MLLVENHGGRRAYPHGGGKAELPRAWVKPDTEFPRPFALSRDGTMLSLADLIYHIDTGMASRPAALPAGELARGPAFSADGRFVARKNRAEVQICAAGTNDVI